MQVTLDRARKAEAYLTPFINSIVEEDHGVCAPSSLPPSSPPRVLPCGWQRAGPQPDARAGRAQKLTGLDHALKSGASLKRKIQLVQHEKSDDHLMSAHEVRRRLAGPPMNLV